MAYKIQFDNGHTVEFDAQPSDADIDEAYAHTKTLVPKIDQSQERENLRAENVQQFYGDVVDNLTGVGQAAASLASSAVAMPAGFAAGLLQKANDPSGVDFEKQVAANMDRLTYHPSREKGEEYLAPVGKLFNDVGIPALAHLGGTQLPGLKDIQLQRAASKKTPFPKDTRGLPTLEERMTAAKAEQLKGQGELFPETLKDTTGHASPYDASVIGTTEPITPLRARRQQELQLSPKETLPIDAEGNIGNIDAGTRAAMEQQRKALERELDSTQPIDNLKATEGPGGQQALFDIPESARMRNPTEAVTGDWRVDENGIPVKADLSMEAANLENGAQRNLWGDELPPKHEQEMANVSPLDRAQKPIGQRGFANKETGALDPLVFKMGFKAVTKALSKLTDKLAADPVWLAGMKRAFNGNDVLRNSDGTPKVLLHGTTADIVGKIATRGQGFHAGYGADSHFFTQNPTASGSKSYLDSKAQRRNGQMYPVVIKDGTYPTLKADAGDWSPKEILRKDKDAAREIRQYIQNALKRTGYTDAQIEGFFNYVNNARGVTETNLAFTDVLKRAGIDGFFYENKKESPRTAKLFSMQGRDDILKRRQFVRENAENPLSFVTWNDRNFKGVYEAPSTPGGAPRTSKPIGERGFANKQTGAIQLPFGRKDAAEQIKKIGAFKKGAFFAEERSIPQLIEDLKANPVKDIDQNIAQKISNSLTKGSIYMTDRTNNPVLKAVGDKIRQATNTALSVIREQVHDKLAPAWRDLSRDEYTEAGAMMIAAEKAKFDLTPEFLRKEGMNDKQINAIMAQKEVMADMLERTNAGLRALGKKEISGNVSNLASRANGDFRRVIVNKDNQVVGVVGARTRYGLNSQIKKLIAEHPEYKVGDEMYFGGRGKRAMDEGFAQLMDFLNQNDPNVKKFVEDLSGVISKDAFDYMNAKTHTMQKKGVFGMTGRKYGADMHQNVRDMVDAQIQHAETITKWSEISKAVGELKPLLEPRNGIEMPLAKQMARDYIEGALGNGPGAVGRALDDVFSGIGKTTGIGTSIPAHILSTNKKVVNGLLIGFGKLPFIAANMIQPVKNMIGQAAYLRSNGFETGFTMGMGKAMDTILREQFGKKLSALDEGAIQYARDNHVYSSSLFEAGNYSRKGVGYWWDHASQVGANKVEMLTRKMTFLSYVNMLHENGIKVSDGLYKAAQNLTDVHMNNYANAEAPRVFQTLGGVGKSAYNLLSFKHNELSRIAMLAREIGKNGDARPLLWEMASQIAFGGIMGTILYQEANWAIEQITKAMGKPTSLTKILLENSDKLSTVFSRGAPTLAGIDMSTSLGMTVTPEPGLDMLHPGLGKTVDIAKAGYDAVTKPSAYNAANLVREAAPLSVAGLINTQKPFAKEQANGNTMLRNPGTGEGTVTLTPAETFIKRLGFKSVGESTQKGLLFANDKISKVYAEKRGKVIDAALKNYTVYGKLPEGWAQDYVKNQGDPNTAVTEITNKLKAANVDRPTRELLINSMSNSVTSTHKLLRSLKKE